MIIASPGCIPKVLILALHVWPELQQTERKLLGPYNQLLRLQKQLDLRIPSTNNEHACTPQSSCSEFHKNGGLHNTGEDAQVIVNTVVEGDLYMARPIAFTGVT